MGYARGILQIACLNSMAHRSINGRMVELTDMLARYGSLNRFERDGGLPELAPAEFLKFSEAIDDAIAAFHDLEICADALDAFETCVLCGAETDVPVRTSIDLRIGYIEGVGQLCAKCAKEQT